MAKPFPLVALTLLAVALVAAGRAHAWVYVDGKRNNVGPFCYF